MEPIEILIILLVIGIIAKVTVIDRMDLYIAEIKQGRTDTLSFFTNIGKEVTHTIIQILTNKSVIIGLIAIAIPFLLYWNYRLNNKLSAKLKRREESIQEAKRKIREEDQRVRHLLNTNPKSLDVHQVQTFIKDIEAGILFVQGLDRWKESKPELLEQLESANKVYEERKHQSSIKGLIYEKGKLIEEVEKLKKEKKENEWEDHKIEQNILRYLEVYSNNVYYKDELDEGYAEVLEKNKYEQVNEYDPFNKKIMTVLVKKIQNHSATHTFLVWAVKKLVEDIKNTEYVDDHITKCADITFRYKKKWYALEIETGTLLEKPKQLKAKLASLNRKYGKRWMFVVSNKDLLTQYRKWGPSTQRSEVEEKLKKWLDS